MLSLALLQSLQGDLNEPTRGIQYLCLIRGIVTGEFRQLRDVPIAAGRPFAGGVIMNGAVIVGNGLQIVQESFARVCPWPGRLRPWTTRASQKRSAAAVLSRQNHTNPTGMNRLVKVARQQLEQRERRHSLVGASALINNSW